MENLGENNKEERSLMLSKKLIELRMKKATRQKFKPDEFTKTKKELAQLLTPEEILDKSKMKNTPDSTPMGS
jgi:ribosomal protein L29